MDITVLRPTMIFGDLCDHNIQKFIKMVDRLPFMPEIDHGACLLQPVNARDLGKAYYEVMVREHLPERYYDVSGANEISMREIIELIGNYLGKRVRFLSLPLSVGCFGAKVVKTLSLGRCDYVERVLRMSENRNYGHEAAAHDFKYKPELFRIGLQREVDEYLQKVGTNNG